MRLYSRLWQVLDAYYEADRTLCPSGFPCSFGHCYGGLQHRSYVNYHPAFGAHPYPDIYAHVGPHSYVAINTPTYGYSKTSIQPISQSRGAL